MLKTIRQNLIKLKTYILFVLILTVVLVFYQLTREVTKKQNLDLDIRLNAQLTQIRNPVLTNLMIFISDVGEIGGLILIGLVVTILGLKKYFNRAINLLAIVGSAGFLTWILKNLVARNRPDVAFRLVSESDFSYPSGHSTIAFTIYPVLAIYIFNHCKISIGLRNVLIGMLLFFPFIVAFSRLYLGVHYFTDVVAGAIIGLSLSSLYYFLNRNKTKTEIKPN